MKNHHHPKCLLTVQALAADDREVLSELTIMISDEDISVTMPLFAQQPDEDSRLTVAAMLASVIVVLGTATAVLVKFVLRRRMT